MCSSVARERRHGHHAVDHRLDEARGERALDVVHGAEARDDVAQVALLEVADRKPQQMREDIGDPLEIQRRAEVGHDPRAQQGESDLHDGEHQESQAQHREQVAIA